METHHLVLADDVDALRAIVAAQAGRPAEQARKLQSRDMLKAKLAVSNGRRPARPPGAMDRAIEQLDLAQEDSEAAEAGAVIPALSSI